MKQAAGIVIAALLLGAGLYAVSYRAFMQPVMQKASAPEPELEWLRQAFGLDEEQLRRIAPLHAGHRTVCDAFCIRLAETRGRVQELFARGGPELEEALRDLSEIEQACRKATLAYVDAVGEEMTPETRAEFSRTMLARLFPDQGGFYLRASPPEHGRH